MRRVWMVSASVLIGLPAPISAQMAAPGSSVEPSSAIASRGRVEGRVLDPEGLGIPGVELVLEGGDLAWSRRTVSEGARGTFVFDDLPRPSSFTLRAGGTGLYKPARLPVQLDAASVRLDVHLSLGFSTEVTVTDTREGRMRRETPATVNTADRQAIDRLKPTHPGQVLSQMPGVWVSTTSGEGHQTAIRQPLTTNPVYLYLEDGVPTRSTGFFNHNALYEINVPNAEGIEVTKGPGSALYGSDALGGVVNVVTRSALAASPFEMDAEIGGHGWRRVVAGGGISRGLNGLRADVNLTHSDGWRNATGYDRQSATLRWECATPSGTAWRTTAALSHIDQQTAGSSGLPEPDFFNRPERNLTPISFRRVQALRISSDYQRILGRTSFEVIPYARHNSMDLLANWTLHFDPTVSDTSHGSLGTLAKLRHSWTRWRTDLVAGVDVDWSPGGRVERQITPSTVRPGDGSVIFTAYQDGPLVYDYDVTYSNVAPYGQVEISPATRLRLTFGLRFDTSAYDYRDRMTAEETPRHRRPESTVRRYQALSPKLGATYQVNDAVNAFASYRHAFRTPSEGQLFRQGSARNTVDLVPVQAHNYEAGVRARMTKAVSFEGSVYRLVKYDDILSYRDPLDGLTTVVNAGETRHEGVELALTVRPAAWVQAAASISRARHTYEEWLVDPQAGIDYSGQVMESAPETLGGISLLVTPHDRTSLSADLTRVGGYWMDALNTQRYGGHTLLDLRGELALSRRLAVFARVLNVTNRRFAEGASYTIQRGRELAPGMPRTGYVGLSVEWKR